MQSANGPMSALDSLRTVEFRQTLRGYHIDDVDEYLEKVAVEAEALQEQLRQSAERMRQATDRIMQLEQQQQQQPSSSSPAPAATPSGAGAEETLQRTLILAQKFVDQTHAEAEAQAKSVVEQAEQKARALVTEAEARARKVAEESEHRLRAEVARLEGLRTKLAGDVDTISQHLESERARLRGALGEMLHFIEERLQPSATLQPAEPAPERPAAGAPGERPAAERPAAERYGVPTAEAERSRQGLMSLGSAVNTPNGR